jgi:hypothetical protein
MEKALHQNQLFGNIVDNQNRTIVLTAGDCYPMHLDRDLNASVFLGNSLATAPTSTE